MLTNVGSNPTRANPTRANPTRANLTRANHTRANHTRANPTPANPTRANPTRASCNFFRATLDHPAYFRFAENCFEHLDEVPLEYSKRAA